jgi:hypothetical protein
MLLHGPCSRAFFTVSQSDTTWEACNFCCTSPHHQSHATRTCHFFALLRTALQCASSVWFNEYSFVDATDECVSSRSVELCSAAGNTPASPEQMQRLQGMNASAVSFPKYNLHADQQMFAKISGICNRTCVALPSRGRQVCGLEI